MPALRPLLAFSCIALVFLTSFFEYSAALEEWTSLTPLPVFTGGGQAASLYGTIVFFHENLGLMYHIDLDAWTTVPSYPKAREKAEIVSVSVTKAIAVGGNTPGVEVDKVEMFDSVALSWVTVSPLPVARLGVACAHDLDDVVYCTGGHYTTLSRRATWTYTHSTDDWVTVKAMPTGRSGAGGGYLSGGYVMVVGGNPGTDPSIPTLSEIYTVVSDTWTTAALAPNSKGNIKALPCVGSLCYAIGGNIFPKSTHVYTRETDTWTTIASSPSDHNGHASVMMPNGLVYVIGDNTAGAIMERLQAQPLGSSPWSAVSPIPAYSQVSNSAGQAVAYGNKVVAIFRDEAHAFDEATDTWTTIATQPDASLYNSGSAPYPGGVAMVGGYNGTTAFDTLYTYNVDANLWSQRTPMPTQRGYLAADGDNAFLWAIAGLGGSNLAVEEYNVALDSWKSKTDLPSGNNRCSAAYWASTVVVVGGFTPTKRLCHSLSAPSDTWTTCAAPPIDYYEPHEVLVARNNLFFISGGSQEDKRKLHKFQLDLNTWTTLDPSPYPHMFTMGALTDSGRYYLIGSAFTLHATIVHAYSTGLVGDFSVVGDPVFTTIFGSVYKLSLRPGLFNLLSTPSVMVNAVVETLDAFPAEENTFVTMVGIVSKRNDSLTTIYFSTPPNSEFPILEITSEECVENIVSIRPGVTTFHLPGLKFSVYALRVAVIPSGVTVSESSLSSTLASDSESSCLPNHDTESSRLPHHDTESSRLPRHDTESSRSSPQTRYSELSLRSPPASDSEPSHLPRHDTESSRSSPQTRHSEVSSRSPHGDSEPSHLSRETESLRSSPQTIDSESSRLSRRTSADGSEASLSSHGTSTSGSESSRSSPRTSTMGSEAPCSFPQGYINVHVTAAGGVVGGLLGDLNRFS